MTPNTPSTGSGGDATNGTDRVYRPTYATDRISGKVYYIDHEGFFWPVVRTAQEIMQTMPHAIMSFLTGPPPEERLGNQQHWRR